MYDVSAQGVDGCMINVHYYYYNYNVVIVLHVNLYDNSTTTNINNYNRDFMEHFLRFKVLYNLKRKLCACVHLNDEISILLSLKSMKRANTPTNVNDIYNTVLINMFMHTKHN